MKKLFTVYDEKVNSYGSPFVASSDGEASRMLSDAIDDPNSLIARHPEDFSLYCVGEYNELSGIVTAYDAPQFIVKCNTLNA